MDAREQRFVEEYVIDMDPQRAAIAAGYSATTARNKAYTWVSRSQPVKPHVMAAIKELMREKADRTQITADMVMKRWWDLANANPNELIEHRRVCCRHCYGEGHRFQWKDEAEWEEACQRAQAEDRSPPTNKGGFGFNPTLHPHPHCPDCFGEGYGQVFAKDTRNLSPGAQALYAGVKQTKEGFEIKMHDPSKALENIARHLGMFNDKLMLQGDKENPITLLLKQVSGRTIMPGDDQ